MCVHVCIHACCVWLVKGGSQGQVEKPRATHRQRQIGVKLLVHADREVSCVVELRTEWTSNYWCVLIREWVERVHDIHTGTVTWWVWECEWVREVEREVERERGREGEREKMHTACIQNLRQYTFIQGAFENRITIHMCRCHSCTHNTTFISKEFLFPLLNHPQNP